MLSTYLQLKIVYYFINTYTVNVYFNIMQTCLLKYIFKMIRKGVKSIINKDKNNKSALGTTSTRIYQQLRQRILQNELTANQPIRQDKVAAQFNVSKIPVREALRQLESDGLVEFKPRCGAFVTELNEADIIENLEIRIALETHALKLAIPNITTADIELAEKILIKYQKVDDIERWSELNGQFHHCLYAPCALPQLMAMIENIKDRTSSFMRLKITQVSGLERPHSEHIVILNACKDGNIKLAVELLQKHIHCTKKEVTAHFRKKKIKCISVSTR
jgi:DNA-binding GntR family transcriptional regulator